MDKFQKSLKEVKTELKKFKEIKRVVLYGSVARGDYSLRHSDLDLFIFLYKKKTIEKTKKKIIEVLNKIGLKNGVKIQPEFQGEEIEEKSHTLLVKLIEEGKIMIDNEKKEKPFFGLKPYYIYEYNSSKSPQQSLFSKVLNGKKSTYLKNGKKVTKYYKGLVDGKKIIKIGNALIVEKKKDQYIQMLFDKFKIEAKFRRMVFMLD